MRDEDVTLHLSILEMERIIQALLDQEEGISALSDRLIDQYETLAGGGA